MTEPTDLVVDKEVSAALTEGPHFLKTVCIQRDKSNRINVGVVNRRDEFYAFASFSIEEFKAMMVLLGL